MTQYKSLASFCFIYWDQFLLLSPKCRGTPRSFLGFCPLLQSSHPFPWLLSSPLCKWPSSLYLSPDNWPSSLTAFGCDGELPATPLTQVSSTDLDDLAVCPMSVTYKDALLVQMKDLPRERRKPHQWMQVALLPNQSLHLSPTALLKLHI